MTYSQINPTKVGGFLTQTLKGKNNAKDKQIKRSIKDR